MNGQFKDGEKIQMYVSEGFEIFSPSNVYSIIKVNIMWFNTSYNSIMERNVTGINKYEFHEL